MVGSLAARRRRVMVAGMGVLLPLLASAQQEQIFIPPSLVVPNFNRVFPGLGESIEAGASLVRSGTPPAIWYNPAGLVKATRTEVNASVQGYQLTFVSGSVVLDGGAQQGNFGTVPTFVGIIFGEEAIHIEKVRFGFGVANNISWSQGINSAVQRPSSAKVLYGVKSQMQQYQGIAAVSYAASDSFRLGFSLAIPYTWVSDNGQLNASLNQGVSTTSTFRTVNFSGYNFHLLPKAGLQWDALSWLSLGAVVAPPGLRVIQGGDLTIQALGTTNSATSSVSEQQSFRDTSATFKYVIPAEISGGFSLHFGPVDLELDAHWFLATGTYNLFQSTAPIVATTAILGSPPSTVTGSFPTQLWGTRSFVDFNLGARYKVSQLITLLAGFYTSNAPGAVPSNFFVPITLYGARAGVSFNTPSLSGSVGLGYEWGNTAVPLVDETVSTGPVTFNETLSVGTLSLLFALSYTF